MAATALAARGASPTRATLQGGARGTSAAPLPLHASARPLELACSLSGPPLLAHLTLARLTQQARAGAASPSPASHSTAQPLLSEERGVRAVLARDARALRALFGHYAHKRVASLPPSAAHGASSALGDPSVLTPSDVARFAADFGVTPALLSPAQLQHLLLGSLAACAHQQQQQAPRMAPASGDDVDLMSGGDGEGRQHKLRSGGLQLSVPTDGVVRVSLPAWTELLARVGVLGYASAACGRPVPDAGAMAAVYHSASQDRHDGSPEGGAALSASALWVLRYLDSHGGRERLGRDGRAGAALASTLRFATRGAAV